MKGFLKGCLKFIAVIAIIYGAYRVYEWIRYAPSRNPHPKYTMTVEGKIDPALQGAIRLKLMTTYYTTNPACRISINWLEGVSRYRTHVDSIRVKPGDAGNYRYEIPLDKFLPGQCGWQLLTVQYAILKQGDMDELETFYFANKQMDNTKAGIQRTLTCQEKDKKFGCDYTQFERFTPISSRASDLSLSKNYLLQYNILRRP